MTVKQGIRRVLIKKTLLLLCVAVTLGALCYYTGSHKVFDFHGLRLTYTLVSAVLSLLILAYFAWKIHYFHNLFAKEWTGTVISVKREYIRQLRARMNLAMDDLVMVVMLDESGKKVKLRLPYGKVGKVYYNGDRVHRLKGTRFPINLTREVEQHICPICGHNSIYGDECPNCKIQY
jgi:hypothetical protein